MKCEQKTVRNIPTQVVRSDLNYCPLLAVFALIREFKVNLVTASQIFRSFTYFSRAKGRYYFLLEGKAERIRFVQPGKVMV